MRVSHIVLDQLQRETAMSDLTRREVIKKMTKMTATAAAVGVAALGVPSSADAQIIGDFWVYCPKCGMADKVSDVTLNHNCSKCGTQTVRNGEGIVECEKGHHPPGNRVSGVTRQHRCEQPMPGGGVCGRQSAGCRTPPNANK
jgi:hypothetical protein